MDAASPPPDPTTPALPPESSPSAAAPDGVGAPAPPPRARAVWPVFAGFGIALGFVVAGSTVVTVVALVASGQPPTGLDEAAVMKIPGLLVGSLWSTQLSLVIAGLGAALVFRDAAGGLRARLQLHGSRARVLDVLLLTLALLGLGHGAEALALQAGLWSGALAAMPGAVRALGPVSFALLLAAGSAGAGLCEELFFRGFVQPPLVERFGAGAAVVTSAALFGAVHLDLLHSPLAFLMGLLLGWAAWRAGSIVPGIVAHGLNNLVSFTTMRVDLDFPGTATPAGAALGLSVCAAAVLVLRQRWRSPAPQPVAR